MQQPIEGLGLPTDCSGVTSTYHKTNVCSLNQYRNEMWSACHPHIGSLIILLSLISLNLCLCRGKWTLLKQGIAVQGVVQWRLVSWLLEDSCEGLKGNLVTEQLQWSYVNPGKLLIDINQQNKKGLNRNNKYYNPQQESKIK